MAEIVNLNRARKARARAEREAGAHENRARFGRPKSERDLAAARERLAAERHDLLKLDRAGPADRDDGNDKND